MSFGSFGFKLNSASSMSSQALPKVPPKPLTSQEIKEAKEGGLGPRWPKGMWDNMDSEWNMNNNKN